MLSMLYRDMRNYKIIHDTVHGSIKFEGLLLDLIELPELQRLHSIHQLGLVYLVFPGANHTRLEHSIGTCHVAERIAKALGLSEHEVLLISTAALLHDIGHSPFSHTLELILHDIMDLDHEDITKSMILGERGILGEDGANLQCQDVPGILEKYDVDPKELVDLVGDHASDESVTKIEDFEVHNKQQFFNEKRYLNQIIHGPIDADQIDYLLRDSHYTGVAHGTIDIDRLIQTMQVFNNDLVIHKRGVSAVEGMLVARALMFSSVYFHKTVRIADLMLARAVEGLDKSASEIQMMIDSELISELKDHGGFQRDIALMLKYRQLFKRVFALPRSDVPDEIREALISLQDVDVRKEKEKELCRKAKTPEGYAIIDVPEKEIKITEPRLQETKVKILENNRLKPLAKYTPLAKALQLRDAYDWEVMVSTAPKYGTQVGKIAEKVLFG